VGRLREHLGRGGRARAVRWGDVRCAAGGVGALLVIRCRHVLVLLALSSPCPCLGAGLVCVSRGWASASWACCIAYCPGPGCGCRGSGHAGHDGRGCGIHWSVPALRLGLEACWGWAATSSGCSGARASAAACVWAWAGAQSVDAFLLVLGAAIPHAFLVRVLGAWLDDGRGFVHALGVWGEDGLRGAEDAHGRHVWGWARASTGASTPPYASSCSSCAFPAPGCASALLVGVGHVAVDAPELALRPRLGRCLPSGAWRVVTTVPARAHRSHPGLLLGVHGMHPAHHPAVHLAAHTT
jgi:hypothetical protein